jgi:type I restriction enzyme S subunit
VTELPRGWAWATLGAVATWGSGGTPRAGDARYYGDGIPWAVIGDLNDGVIQQTAASITEEGLRSSSAKVVPEGTILMALYGSIGKLGIAGTSMATNQAIVFARPTEALESRFLFWFLRSERDAFMSAGKGATQKNISQTVIRPWPIPVPPLAEQRRVVTAIEEQLSRLDTGDECLKRARRKLENLRNQAVEAAFAGEWPCTTLGEIAEIVGGVTKDAKRQADPSFVEVPYLRVANVQRGFLDLTDVATIRVPREKAKALELEVGDVLFNEGGDRDKLGRGWVWSGEVERCIHQNHVFRARLRNGFEPKFVSWHGNTFGRRWFEEHGRQTTNLASLNLTTLKSFPVPVPPLEKQRRVVAEVERQLSIADAMAAEIEHGLLRSAALRRSILARAFRGELTPQEPDDESASVLLERIAAERATAPTSRRRRIERTSP